MSFRSQEGDELELGHTMRGPNLIGLSTKTLNTNERKKEGKKMSCVCVKGFSFSKISIFW